MDNDEIEVACARCKKKLSSYKMHFLPGKVIYDKLSDITYNTGRNYCEECFAHITTTTFEVGTKKYKIKEKVIRHVPKGPNRYENKTIEVFKGQMPPYEVKKDKISGFIQKIIHAISKNGAPYKVVKFKDDNRHFYVWDKKLYENIKAGDIVEVEFIQTKFPRIVMIKKSV